MFAGVASRSLRSGLHAGFLAAIDSGSLTALSLLASGTGGSAGATGCSRALSVPLSRCYSQQAHLCLQPSSVAGQQVLSDHPHHTYADTHRPDQEHVHHRAGHRHLSHHGHGHTHHGHCHEQVHHPNLHKRHHRPPGPDNSALTALGERYGVADDKSFRHAVHKLPVVRQHALLEHAEGVAQYLQGLGIGSEQVARMLQHCPALFTWAAEERARVLLSELMGDKVGRSASQAAELFVKCPALANTRHVMPSIVKLVAEHHAD